MEDREQVLQDKVAISRAFEVDTPPRPGDEGAETPLSEYSLHFKLSLCPWMYGSRSAFGKRRDA